MSQHDGSNHAAERARQSKRESARQIRASESPAQRRSRLDAVNLREKRRRDNETEEESQARRARRAQLQSDRIARESSEQAEQRRAREAAARARRRALPKKFDAARCDIDNFNERELPVCGPNGSKQLDLGVQDLTCQKCGAKMWDAEKLSKSTRRSGPLFSMCCNDGKVELKLCTHGLQFI